MRALQEERLEQIQDITIERDNKRRTVKIEITCKMKSGNTVEVVREIG